MTDNNGEQRGLAPVIPMFGGRVHRASDLPGGGAQTGCGDYDRHSVGAPAAGLDCCDGGDFDEPDVFDLDEVRRNAEQALLRKLRARSLSVSEARQVLRGHGLDSAEIDDVIDDYCHRRYLDDAELARQLVMSGVDRKGQGRVALSRALSQRGIARETADAALAELPDDDAERALEFARTKARSLSRLEFEVALRRLVGQLARRGYGGSVAMTAARTALSEASIGKGTGGVRFVDSE